MSKRDAVQKDEIEKRKVKVNFGTHFADDSMYRVDAPGNLYLLQSPYSIFKRWQFADMSNGSYYMVTRVKTNGIFLKMDSPGILKVIDSLLYENIPGKILSKKSIVKNSYPGYDIINKTRRGDMQRYQVFAIATEVIIFKMSGKNDYVAGEEGNRFFSSIQLRQRSVFSQRFYPKQGGFSIHLPQEPTQYFDNTEQNRWEYEAKDTANGDAYLVMKKSLYNFDFIEEDSFELKMPEESFRSPDFFGEQISRRYGWVQQFPALFVREKLKEGDVVNAVFIVKAPHYYVLAKRTSNLADSSFAFINSFKWEPYQYQQSVELIDSFYFIKMLSQVKPNLDKGMREIIENINKATAEMGSSQGYYSYWPAKKNILLKSDSTGEAVSITIQEFPAYYYLNNLDKFWQYQWEEDMQGDDMYLGIKQPLRTPNFGKGYYYTLRDTGSAKTIERMVLLDGKFKYSLYGVSDTLTGLTGLTKTVFESFTFLTPIATVFTRTRYLRFLTIYTVQTVPFTKKL